MQGPGGRSMRGHVREDDKQWFLSSVHYGLEAGVVKIGYIGTEASVIGLSVQVQIIARRHVEWPPFLLNQMYVVYTMSAPD